MGVNVMVSHSVAVAVMVMDTDSKFLLVKSYDRGWNFPGGFVGEHEFIKGGTIREAKKRQGYRFN